MEEAFGFACASAFRFAAAFRAFSCATDGGQQLSAAADVGEGAVDPFPRRFQIVVVVEEAVGTLLPVDLAGFDVRLEHVVGDMSTVMSFAVSSASAFV